MNLISVYSDSLCGEAYKKFFSFLCNASDTVAFTVQSTDEIIDDEDRKYAENINETKKRFAPFIASCFEANCFGLTKGGNRKITTVRLSNKAVCDYFLKYDSIDHWNYPDDVEDLCFFKKGVCVFASVSHEDMYLFYSDNEDDINFLKDINLKFDVYKIKKSDVPILNK